MINMQLSDRQCGVMWCIFSGMSNKQIAEHYSLSAQTIKNHVTACMGKIGTKDRTNLALWWWRYAVEGNAEPQYSPDKRYFQINANTKRKKDAPGNGVTTAQMKELKASVGVCEACGSADDLTIDHVIPLSCGGRNDLDNCQVLCRTCNSKKGIGSQDYRK